MRRIAWGHVIVRAEGDGRVQQATIAKAGRDWAPTGRERTFDVDAVCTAYGFTPSVELARALGCDLHDAGVAHDEDMRTSVDGVFVAGEVSGVGGSDLASVEGELAGSMAAATWPLRRGRTATRRWPSRAPRLTARARAKLAGFAGILADLFDPRPGLLGLATPTTVLCRCEDVTAGAIDDAVAEGATDDGRAEDRHALRPGAVPGPRLRAAGLRAAAGARALQRPGPDPPDPARGLVSELGLVVDNVNVSVWL